MSSYIKRRESIILSAIEIIDDLGFQGMSIKEICRREDVTEETLFQHIYRLRKSFRYHPGFMQRDYVKVKDAQI
ncbi:hypothetical protein [Petroclostridium sp. X23]|uniref:hypothetical protein n=1 Tax=Petroclostridium sp. X23 TaxID=3045146 RepID=UPI0024AD50D6|nr:hypothetical protein [Petroclostridium sp. X23]WHH61376.1 hypothetical protein QKW49_12005 [Petroclostridium sp. X23]